MNEPSLLDAFGISLDEVLAMQSRARAETFSDKGQFARLATARRTHDRGAHIAEQLWECKQILSAAGVYKSIDLVRTLTESGTASQPDWGRILERVFDEPVAFRNRVVWLFFHACLQAERDFALDVCPAHAREDSLTGRLIEGIKGACASWGAASSTYLSRIQNVLEVGSIDLSVGGGEQKNGGDFALILDIKENAPFPGDLDPGVITLTGGPRGHIFVPLLFQAKCYTGANADISQKHKTRGYQFNRLRQVKCASNYIFYENGPKGVKIPALPMVKPVSACKPVEISRNTEVFQESVNLASYLLRVANGFDSIPVALTRADALNMILANTSPDSITKIVILGNTSGLERAYETALLQLRNEIANEAEPEPPSDDDLSDGPRLFKP